MEDNHISNKGFPKTKVLRYIIPLVIIGFVAGILLVKMTTFENTLEVIQSMQLWLVGLAILAQIGSYLGSGFILSAIMRLGKSKLSIGRGALITMAAASIGLVAGGWVSSSAITYFWVSKNKDAEDEAILTGILPGIYNILMLISVTIIGMLFLLINHELSQSQIITYSLLLGFILLIVIITLFVLKNQNRVERLTTWFIKLINRFLKHKRDIATYHEKIEKFYNRIKHLTLKDWVLPGLGSIANIVFDMLTLFLCFRASGHPVKLSVLISGYSLAFLIGKVAFFIPGGIGVVEGGMTAIFTSLGIASHFSVVAVLSYRLMSFWLPILLGFLVTIYLQRTSDKKTELGEASS